MRSSIDSIEHSLDSGEGATHSIDPQTGQCECNECFMYRIGARAVNAEHNTPYGLPTVTCFDDKWYCGRRKRDVFVWRAESSNGKKQPVTAYHVCYITSKESREWADFGPTRNVLCLAREKINWLIAREAERDEGSKGDENKAD